jgi:ABC-type glycerol-3-phosphate transport system substrate-binding protein
VLKSQAPEQAGKWRVAPWPMWPGQSRRISGEFGGGLLTIPRQARHPDEAAQWIEFVAASRAGQEAIYRNGQWPAFKPVLDSAAVKQGDPYLGGQVWADVLAQQGSAPFNWFHWTETTAIIGSEIDAMMAGQKTAEQAWRDAERLLAERYNR